MSDRLSSKHLSRGEHVTKSCPGCVEGIDFVCMYMQIRDSSPSPQRSNVKGLRQFGPQFNARCELLAEIDVLQNSEAVPFVTSERVDEYHMFFIYLCIYFKWGQILSKSIYIVNRWTLEWANFSSDGEPMGYIFLQRGRDGSAADEWSNNLIGVKIHYI